MIDDNVLVSAALSKGNPLEVVERVRESEILLMSEDVALELVEVLGRPKFDKYTDPAVRNDFLEAVLESSSEVQIAEMILLAAIRKIICFSDSRFLETQTS